MTQGNLIPPRQALITGGASGFGWAIAQALLAQGAQVAIGDNHPERLATATASLPHANLLALELDVTSPASARAAVAACEAHFGGLDTLVNSAGIIYFTPLAAISEAEWDRVIDVDLKGPFVCAQAAAPLLCASGRGRIVNIGSDASKVGFPMLAHYCAAKAGVVGLTKVLAGELASHQVTVNCVCPVGVSGPAMGQDVLNWKIRTTGLPAAEILAATANSIPLKRNPTVADIVHAVLFFLSAEAAFLTGLALDVDGGMLSTIPLPGVAE